ncbi:MAG: hypothetical protein MNSN_03780 [Minisyncoccus archaeiphilus]|nr:MAG: hypothetical protein MNSN_03780 [Candidatus Parcubacteria bacterium]
MKVNIFALASKLGVKVDGKKFEPCKARITETEIFFDAEQRREEINAM